jgi:hypothetical protein
VADLDRHFDEAHKGALAVARHVKRRRLEDAIHEAHDLLDELIQLSNFLDPEELQLKGDTDGRSGDSGVLSDGLRGDALP